MALGGKMKRLSFNSNSSKSTRTTGSDCLQERTSKPSHQFVQSQHTNISPTAAKKRHNLPQYDAFVTTSSPSENQSGLPSSAEFEQTHHRNFQPQKPRDSVSKRGSEQSTLLAQNPQLEKDLYRYLRLTEYHLPTTHNTCPSPSRNLPHNLNTGRSTELVDIDLSTLALYQNISRSPASNTLESPQAQLALDLTHTPSPTQPLLDSPKDFSFSHKASNPIQHDQDNTGFFAEPVHQIGTRDHDSELNAPLVFDIKSFQSYLLLAEFRSAFRDWLSLDPELNHDGLLKLDRWMDEMKAESLVKAVREYSLSLFGVYHADGNQARSSFLPGAVVQETLSNLSRLAVLESGLQSSRSCLVTSLHENEFHSFIRAKLITRVTDRRNVYKLSDANSEIHRPSFCLTNPRVANNPIVMVSPELLQLTRYEASDVIGKTCQLFYGTATSPSSIYRVGSALEEGQSCVEILLTYRKDGSSTLCLWTFDPLHGPDGEVMFFVARQTDVAKELDVPLVRFLGLNVPRVEAAQLTIEEMPCSPRMQSHRYNQHNLNGLQMKHSSRNVRTYTATSASGGASIHAGRGERSPSVSKNGSHPHSTKKDWLTNGVTSVKGVLRRGGTGTQRFDALSSSPSVPEFPSLVYPDPNLTSSNFRRTCHPSHYLMVIKRRDHRIMYANANTLKFFGLPTKSLKNVYDPPLLRKDLLRLLHGRTEKETRGLRNFVEELLARGRAGCCECELNYDQGTIEYSNNGPERVSLSGELSSLHFTPLISPKGHCALYVVSFDST